MCEKLFYCRRGCCSVTWRLSSSLNTKEERKVDEKKTEKKEYTEPELRKREKLVEVTEGGEVQAAT